MDIIKIYRLLGIITILLQKEKVTTSYLAEKFEVSKRPILRDIDSISQAGIPITTIQGYEGGVSISPGYKIDKSIFTIDDLEMIFTGLKTLESISDTPYMDILKDKLSNREDKIISNAEPIIIDLVSTDKSELASKIKIIKFAINKKQCIKFNYYYNKGDVVRRVEPYLLIFKWSSWHVLSYCLEKEDFRLFKLNRLWNIEDLNETFEPREIPEKSLLVGDYFKNTIKLTAIFDEKQKYRLIDEYGIDSIKYLDNKVLFEGEFTNKDKLISWVLSFGSNVEIIEPKELKEEVVNHAKLILEKYK